MSQKFDVIIIGAGAIGCAVARELSKYELNVAVMEKGCDVASGTSSKNSGVVHAGFNNRPGSLMAKLCVEGNLGFEKVCKDLDVPYKKTGKLIVAFNDEDLKTLDVLMENGHKNEVPGLKLLSAEELREIDPKVGGIGAMLSAETAITCPFLYTIALAENAAANGVEFFFGTEITSISKNDELFNVQSKDACFASKYVINSAGLFSDEVSSMTGDNEYKIYPCRGEYYLLDKRAGDSLKIPIYPAPRKGIGGLGVHLTPTIHGNVIIGPSAEYIDSKIDTATTDAVLKQLYLEAKQLLPTLDMSLIIGSYSGIRSKIVPPDLGGYGDFIIKKSEKTEGLINLIGIESPGLTASIPIAKMTANLLSEFEELKLKNTFISQRKGITPFKELSEEEQARLIQEDPLYGEIVCRCERITKKEVLMALENPFKIRSLVGIKYRVRAMMGRCQGGYCLTRIIDILIKEYGLSPEEITLRGGKSNLFTGNSKPTDGGVDNG